MGKNDGYMVSSEHQVSKAKAPVIYERGATKKGSNMLEGQSEAETDELSIVSEEYKK